MLLRKQKNNTLVGIDINTIISKSVFEKLLKKESLTKREKSILKEKMNQFSNTVKNMQGDYNSLYIFSNNDYGKLNKYQKIIIEKILKEYDINYKKIVVCPNEFIEAAREFRIDVLVLSDDKHDIGNEKLLDITQNVAKRNKNMDNSYQNFVPDYAQLIYLEDSKNKINTNKIQYINDYYGLVNALDIAKENIENRKKAIFKSYEFVPKTNSPTFDREDKKYWLASKFENGEYDKILQNLSRFEFVMFHNRYNMDDVAYYYEPLKVSYTFNDIKKMVLSAIDYFTNELGLKKGDTVSICLPSCIQDIVAQFALNHIGVVVNPIHPLSSLNKIETFINNTNSKYFIYMNMPKTDDQKEAISLDYLIDKYNLKGVINVSLVEDANKFVKNAFNMKTKVDKIRNKDINRYSLNDESKMVKWNDITKNMGNKSLVLEPSNLSPNDISFYFSTGGTSAKSSKVVKLPHYFDNISYYNTYGINVEKGDVAFSNYPAYIAFCNGNCRHQPAAAGLLTVISPTDYPKDFAKKLEQTKTSVLQVAPQFFRLMLDAEERGEFDGVDLSHFKYVVAGGDKASNELKEEVLSFFSRHNNNNVQFIVGCGCTELGGSTTVQLFELWNTENEKSIGIPLPVFQLRLVDENGNILENGEKTGELLIGIDGIHNIGYANEETLTNNVFKKENDTTWYNTEDVVEFDEKNNGEINFISRNKRFIMITKGNTSGKIVPDDVELQIMANVKEVEIVSVVGIEEENETKLKAAVKLKKGVNVTDELINKIKQAACKKDVLAQIDEIKFIDVMPLTDRQKVKYIEIEDMFKEENKVKKLSLS